MPALLELQWMALAVALNRGVDPDLNLRPEGQAPSRASAAEVGQA
jgi:hypothetical protein